MRKDQQQTEKSTSDFLMMHDDGGWLERGGFTRVWSISLETHGWYVGKGK